MLNRSVWGTSGSRNEDEFPVSEGDMKSPRFMKLKETEGLVGESFSLFCFCIFRRNSFISVLDGSARSFLHSL